MKKILFTSLFYILFANSVFAGSCPMLWAEIDGKLNEIQKLRDAGKDAHSDGDHAKSEELLKKALSMLNN